MTWESRITGHTGHIGPFEHGAFGAHFELSDYAAGGFSFTTPTIERTGAIFGFQDFHVGVNSIQFGARFDYRTVSPSSSYESDIGLIKDRQFGNVSASISMKRKLADGYTLSALAMRSVRLPGI